MNKLVIALAAALAFSPIAALAECQTDTMQGTQSTQTAPATNPAPDANQFPIGLLGLGG